MILCDYGCGREAKYQFKNGKWCCENHYSKCLKVREKSSKSHKGQIPWIKGRNHSELSKKKISDNNKGKKTFRKN